MRQVDLERLLRDPDGRAELDAIANELEDGGGKAAATIDKKPFVRQRPVNARRPTAEEASANDRDHVQWPALHGKISKILPALKGKNPKEVLSRQTDLCHKDPSQHNQVLLEAAINRLTTQDFVDAESEALITKAIQELTRSRSPRGAASSSADSIYTRLYTRDDLEGRSYFINHGPDYVYRRIWRSTLMDALCVNCIDSLYVDASAGETGGEVILFQDDHFEGRYARFTTTPGSPDVRNEYDYVGGHIDNRTSSVLVVRRYANEDTYAVRAVLDGLGALDAIEGRVNAIDPSRIRMRGEVGITWDMWPDGSLADRDPRPNDDRRFVWLRIPVHVNASLHPDRRWINYYAEIRYWIYPWVDDAGNLHGHVSYDGVWVENGIRRSRVRETLEDFLPDTEAEVNDMLDSALAVLNLTGPFRRQYFLPGGGAATGYTSDDVTLVLVRR